MKFNTRMFVVRCFRGLPAFHWSEEKSLPAEILEIIRATDDHILGVYENEPGSLTDCVFITNDALILYNQGVLSRIEFKNISNVDWFPEQKRLADRLKIILQNGSVEFVPVRGHTHGGSDVFEFVRFVGRAADAAQTTKTDAG